LSENEYNKWKKQSELENESQLSEIEISQKEQLILEIEKNIFFLGFTSIKDCLQDKVPEVIYDLKKAKIKVWMVT